MRRRKKHQHPSLKHHRNARSPAPNTERARFEVWLLEFLWCLGFSFSAQIDAPGNAKEPLTMTLPPFLRTSPAGVLVAIKLQPRSSKSGIVNTLGQELKVRVTAAPVDGKANEALLELLADELGCRRSALELVQGATARHKLILVRGLTAEIVAAKLTGKAA